MDPDKLLEELRELVQSVKDYDTCNDSQVDELVEKVEAMDTWLSNGGFFPRKWGVRASS